MNYTVNIDTEIKDLIPVYLDRVKKNISMIESELEFIETFYLKKDDENSLKSIYQSIDFIQNLSHKMKGSGGAYGFHKLSEYCSLIEKESALAKEGLQLLENQYGSNINNLVIKIKEYMDNLIIVYK